MKGLPFAELGESQLYLSAMVILRKEGQSPKTDVGGPGSSLYKWFMLKCYLHLLC